MTIACAICGRDLSRGKGGTRGDCFMCSIRICTRCQKYGFCPTHYDALSPRGQVLMKRAFSTSIVLLPLSILLLFVGETFLVLSSFISNISLTSMNWIFVWLLTLIPQVVVILAFQKVIMRSLWKRYALSPTEVPASC